MGFIAGLRVERFDQEASVTSVPFKFLTKNPFRSMYFAVQSMAAELSTAVPCLIAITDQDPSVAFIIVKNEARFYKKAVSSVYFTCLDTQMAFDAVSQCKDGQPREATFKTIGKMKDGTMVSEFEFTWSFKVRPS